MKIRFHSFYFLFLACLAGCSTGVKPPDANTASIVLKQPQTRYLEPTLGPTVSVPPGIYEPDFEANDGIYYRAPGHLIVKVFGFTQLNRGGIFVPFPETDEQREAIKEEQAKVEKLKAAGVRNYVAVSEPDFQMGVWYDQQESSGGLFEYAASSPKRIYHVNKPFIFEVQTNNP